MIAESHDIGSRHLPTIEDKGDATFGARQWQMVSERPVGWFARCPL